MNCDNKYKKKINIIHLMSHTGGILFKCGTVVQEHTTNKFTSVYPNGFTIGMNKKRSFDLRFRSLPLAT